MKSPSERPVVAPAPCQALRCHRCRRTVGVGMADALVYLTEGWPRCCGEVMELCTDHPKG